MDETGNAANGSGGKASRNLIIGVAVGLFVAVLVAAVVIGRVARYLDERESARVYDSTLGGVAVRIPNPPKAKKTDQFPNVSPDVKINIGFMRENRTKRTVIGYAFTEFTELAEENFDSESFATWKDFMKMVMGDAGVEGINKNIEDMLGAANSKPGGVNVSEFAFIEDTDDALVCVTVSQLMEHTGAVNVVTLESFGVLKGKLYRLAVTGITPPGEKIDNLTTLERNWRAAILAANQDG